MLEESERGFKIMMLNMLMVLKKKVDNMQEQLYNVGREMETLRKNQENAKKKPHCSKEMKNIFSRFISRVSMAEERISKLENKSI